MRLLRKSGLYILPILGCFLLADKIFSQPLEFDSTKLRHHLADLSQNRKDTNTVNELIELARMYKTVNDSAKLVGYAKRAKEVALDIGFNEGVIRSLIVLAFHYSVTGDWPNATLVINEARPYCKGQPERYEILLNNMMFINSMSRNDRPAAKFWALQAYQHPQFTILPEPDKWPTFLQLGYSYLEENNVDSAMFFAEAIKEFPYKYGYGDLSDNTRYLLGDISLKKKNYEQALQYYRWRKPGYYGIASVYRVLGMQDSSVIYARKAVDTATRMNDTRVQLESLKLLSELLETTDLPESHRLLKQYLDLRDKIFTTEKQRSLEEIRLNEQKKVFESEEREAAFRNRLIQLGLIGLALISLIIAIFLLRNNKIRKSANEKLEKAYSNLQQTQAQLIHAEKMASLGELTAGIAHEIQNPLNFVNNFAEVNAELNTEGRDAVKRGDLADIEEIFLSMLDNEQKILQHGKRADAIVKAMLEHSRSSNGVKELTDINKLADEYLRLAYHGMKAKDKLFNCEIIFNPDLAIGKVNVVPQDIGRVLLNLINNALYAVNEKSKASSSDYKPEVSVSTRLHKAGKNEPISQLANELIISVKDNGNGIPENIRNKIFQPFFTTKPTGEGTGLGLSLSYDIIKAHGGEIRVESKEGEGTAFTIQLPIQ